MWVFLTLLFGKYLLLSLELGYTFNDRIEESNLQEGRVMPVRQAWIHTRLHHLHTLLQHKGQGYWAGYRADPGMLKCLEIEAFCFYPRSTYKRYSHYWHACGELQAHGSYDVNQRAFKLRPLTCGIKVRDFSIPRSNLFCLKILGSLADCYTTASREQ